MENTPNPVELAEDVLRLLDTKKISTTHSYLRITEGKELFETAIEDKSSLQHVLLNEQVKCHVCAIGGLFVAYVMRHNNVQSSRDLYGNSDVVAYNLLRPFFPNLAKIESYYEGWGDGYDFRGNNPDDDVRLRMICQNIIDNGEFKPEQFVIDQRVS